MMINDVIQKFNIPIRQLRSYESLGLIKSVKNDYGIKEYQDEDIKRIQMIYCLRKAGMPIDNMKQYFDLQEMGDKTKLQRMAMLIEQREKLIEDDNKSYETIHLLDSKIHSNQTTIQMKGEKSYD